jgi:hypothetical protein
MKFRILVCLSLLFVLTTCQKKSVKIAFAQKECKDLVLKNASYGYTTSPCSTSTGLINNTVRIRVEHNGKPSCLEFFKINASFKDGRGNELPIPAYKSSYISTDPQVTLTNSYIEIEFSYKMQSPNDADALRAIYIDLKLENELKDVSQFFTLTIPMTCVNTNTSGVSYNNVQDVFVSNSQVSLSFLDYSSIDGDIISVYLNGDKVISNLTLTGSFQTYNFTVLNGNNTLVVIAENEGMYSPNTCRVKVDGTSVDLTPGLFTGQGINIVF